MAHRITVATTRPTPGVPMAKQQRDAAAPQLRRQFNAPRHRRDVAPFRLRRADLSRA